MNSRKQKIIATVDLTVKNPQIKSIVNCITARENRGDKQHNGHRKWCCYVNYRYIGDVKVKIAKCLLARDYKGFGSGSELSNGVIEIWESL